jgi:hypothetical protein
MTQRDSQPSSIPGAEQVFELPRPTLNQSKAVNSWPWGSQLGAQSQHEGGNSQHRTGLGLPGKWRRRETVQSVGEWKQW